MKKLVNNVTWDCLVLSQGPRQKGSKVILKNKYQETIVLEPLDVIQDFSGVLHVLLHVDVEAGLGVVQEDALQRCPLDQIQPPRCDHPVERVARWAGSVGRVVVAKIEVEVQGDGGEGDERGQHQEQGHQLCAHHHQTTARAIFSVQRLIQCGLE